MLKMKACVPNIMGNSSGIFMRLSRETFDLRTAFRQDIRLSLLDARRVSQHVMVVPHRLGLSLPGTADLHLPSYSCFPPIISFNGCADTTVSLLTGLWGQVLKPQQNLALNVSGCT